HHLFLGLFHTGDVVEGDVGVFLAGDFMPAAAEVTQHPARPGAVAELTEDEEPDESEDHQPGNEGNQKIDDDVRTILDPDFGVFVVIGQPLHELPIAGHARGHSSVEELDSRLHAGDDFLVAVEFAFEVIAVDGDGFDAIGDPFVFKFAEGDGDVLLALHLEQGDQHDRKSDKEDPPEQTATEAHSTAVGTAGPGGFANRAVWALFCHRWVPLVFIGLLESTGNYEPLRYYFTSPIISRAAGGFPHRIIP